LQLKPIKIEEEEKKIVNIEEEEKKAEIGYDIEP